MKGLRQQPHSSESKLFHSKLIAMTSDLPLAETVSAAVLADCTPALHPQSPTGHELDASSGCSAPDVDEELRRRLAVVFRAAQTQRGANMNSDNPVDSSSSAIYERADSHKSLAESGQCRSTEKLRVTHILSRLQVDVLRRLGVLLLLGVATLFAVNTHAKEPQPAHGSIAPHAYVEPQMAADCQENALRLLECIGQLRDHSRAYLDELVEYIASRLQQQQRELFARSQSAWKEYRDASCKFDEYPAGGNSAAALFASCQHAYNKDRISTLSQYASCIGARSCGDDIRLYRFIGGQLRRRSNR